MAKPRVRKLLELRTDTPEFLESLDSLALLDVSSSLRDPRRHLRFDLEDRSLKLIQSFLLEAGHVELALREVSTLVTELDSQSSKVLKDLESAENSTTRFVQDSSALRELRAKAETRAEETSAFLQRFQLSNQDLMALEQGALTNPDARFFKALERVRKIRDECSELLSSAHQTTGLEIFEQMAEIQNKAQDAVYEWIKRECAAGTTALDNESQRMLYSKAFAEFKFGSLPAYYAHGIELCSQSRRRQVGERFASQVNRQIDPNLDPLRSLSDLLTLLHETVAEERDLFQSIFHSQVGQSSFQHLLSVAASTEEEEGGGDQGENGIPTPTNNKSTVALDANEQQECLERALGGTCVTIRNRAGQCLESIHDSVTCFRAMQILDFYTETMGLFFPVSHNGLGGEDNPLGVISLLKEDGAERFFYLVETKANELLMSSRTHALPGSNLSASFEVLELVRCLREVLFSIRDHGLQTAKVVAPEDTQKALKAFVVPIRHLVQNVDATFSSQADACMFAVNNLAALQAVLTLHEFTSELVEELQFEIGERIDLLARIRAEAALTRTGLNQVLLALDRAPDPPMRLGEQPGLRVEQVKAAFDSFYRELSSSLVMPEFDRIDAPRLRHQARSATCQVILHAHNTLFDAVQTNYPADSVAFLAYTKTQVADLLDV
ncbi:hypothetical protein BASA81_010120 [Batrachochytrium salamandrivorans]|nr:hypothetical protein BASA81_010120 [Batrachochytrium salamandrivorans]